MNEAVNMNPTLQASILALAEEYVSKNKLTDETWYEGGEQASTAEQAFKAGAQAMLDLLSKQEDFPPNYMWIGIDRDDGTPQSVYPVKPEKDYGLDWALYFPAESITAERARSAVLVKALEEMREIKSPGGGAYVLQRIELIASEALKEAGGSDEVEM